MERYLAEIAHAHVVDVGLASRRQKMDKRLVFVRFLIDAAQLIERDAGLCLRVARRQDAAVDGQKVRRKHDLDLLAAHAPQRLLDFRGVAVARDLIGVHGLV